MSSNALKPIVFILAIVMAIILFSIYRSGGQPAPTGAWLTDFSQAQEESGRTGKPILAYFTADWCPPCQKMKRDTFPDPAVQAAMQAYVPLLVDLTTTDRTGLAKRYGVTGVPTLLILNASGQRLAGIAEGRSADSLVQWLQAPRPATAAR